jgi:hypothetical protein
VGAALVLRDRQLKLGGAQLAGETNGDAVATAAGVFAHLMATVDGRDGDRAIFFPIVHRDAVVVKIPLIGAANGAFERYEVIGDELDSVLRNLIRWVKFSHNGLSPLMLEWT